MAAATAADAFGPALGELGVGAQPPGDLELAAEPAGGVAAAAGPVQQVAHHLDEAVAGDRLDHRGGVVLGHREEEGVLVAEVVEDGAAGQPGGLFEAAHGGALVAVPREASAGRGEDLVAAGL